MKYKSYMAFILVGVFMVIGTLLKLTGVWNISSDWFWFLAGIGAVIEGISTLYKQQGFDKKYQVIERKQN